MIPVVDEQGAWWDEPILVNSLSGDGQCEQQDCDNEAVWDLELAGYNGRRDLPTNAPTAKVCGAHLDAQMRAWVA